MSKTSLLSRLFARMVTPGADPREGLRPLWRGVVAAARARGWYARGQVADSVGGRFDMITMVLALVLLRMERSPALAAPSAHLAELFVEDMDGQLRESGVGDLVVGKHIGRLMGVLGGRLGALREALASSDDGALTAVVARNVSFGTAGDAEGIAAGLRRLAEDLAALDDPALLSGALPVPAWPAP